MWASRQDLNHKHATLVTDLALPQRRADEFFITLTIILSTFEGRWFRRRHVQKLSTVRQFLLSVPVGQEAVVADALKALRKHMGFGEQRNKMRSSAFCSIATQHPTSIQSVFTNYRLVVTPTLTCAAVPSAEDGNTIGPDLAHSI